MYNQAMRILLVLAMAADGAGACTVPVFRYALDRWQADPFGLSAGEEWRNGGPGRQIAKLIEVGGANLCWQETEAAEGRISLFWPRSETPAWSGKAADLEVDALVSSPVREEIAKRILAGQSAVWVLVESGDQAGDQAFAARLGKRLEYLGSVAAIPPQDPDDPESQLGPGPDLKVGFSMIRVKRDDPKERFLLPMLAGPEGGDLLGAREPFAAVVFGRGRVLGSWKAAGLEDDGIDEISLFLLGACSCRVKFMNPGWDLLMKIDWDEKLMAAEFARNPGQEGAGEPLPPLEKMEPGK